MTQHHPDLAAEQAYVDHAYECLEQTRRSAWRLRDLNEADLGGTFQARFERNAFDEALVKRLTELDIGQAALVFGRIDRTADSPHGIESFHIGRFAVADESSEPVVVDWRAPVAEPFYRATGRDPMRLVRRRHFVIDGRTVLGLEDELFGHGHLGVGHDDGLVMEAEEAGSSTGREATTPTRGQALRRPADLRGYSTLLASLERGRTGTLGDIVATIQGEQDEIIRSPQAGVLVVQGGPGTGKTVVALHRAAYLLYTHRFPLEDQGVLVIGPNRVFLRYIERVLPSLGEAGVEQAILADLVPDVEWARPGSGDEQRLTAKVKGDIRMVDVIDRAVRDRQRPLRTDTTIAFGTGYLRLTVEESASIVRTARRRFGRHNAGRRFVENEVFSALARSSRNDAIATSDVRDALGSTAEVRMVLERMWPVLTPAELLYDLFGSRALLASAAGRVLSEEEYLSLYRPRAERVHDVRWTPGDVALLDDAREALGPKPRRTGTNGASGGGNGTSDGADEVRTYGHIVIDEVQDLTPMQLRMAARRSLNGSMTVVGDISQATGPLAPDDWPDVLAHLPAQQPSRIVGLSVGYRIPAQIMAVAERVMRVATPTITSPAAVRIGDSAPVFIAAERSSMLATAADETLKLTKDLPSGLVAVVVADDMADEMSHMLDAAGVGHGRASRTALDTAVTVVPVSVVKGLELDAVVVVEPSRIVAAQEQGLRALYTALTRPTQRLTVVHADPLPAAMLAEPGRSGT